MSTYEHWNNALLDELFPWTADPGNVYLTVDEDVLGIVAGQLNIVGDPVEQFIKTVRDHVVVDGKFCSEQLAPTNDQPVPQISFLALCVLAAGAMRTSYETRHIASTNYYARLNEMLMLESVGKHRSLNSEEIESQWYLLQEVLRDQDRGELQLTKGPKTRRFIWYPVSQALLSAEDKQKLRDFFVERDYALHFSVTDLNDFGEDLTRWAAAAHRLSKRARRLLAGSHQRFESVVRQAAQELLRWDGQPYLRISTSLRRPQRYRVEIRLDLDMVGTSETCVIIPVRKQLELGLPIIRQNQQIGTLEVSDPQARYFDPIQIENQDWIDGIELYVVNQEHRVQLNRRPDDIVVFHRDPVLFDALVSIPRLRFREESTLLWRSTKSDVVLPMLESLSGIPSESLRVGSSPIFTDWTVLSSFVAIRSIEIHKPELSALAVDSTLRLKLEGGVRLRTDGRRTVYMLGKGPRVVKLGDCSDDATWIVNGSRVGAELELDGSNFSRGLHHVKCDGRSVTFEMVSGDIGAHGYTGNRLVQDPEGYFRWGVQDNSGPSWTIDGPRVFPPYEHIDWDSVTPQAMKVPASRADARTLAFHTAAVRMFRDAAKHSGSESSNPR